jgi:ketosteroid isomerase-like protein
MTSPSTASSAIALVARDHVRLSYEYLDRDDVDGYVSLLAPDVELRRPGRVPVRGRADAEQADRPRGRHRLRAVFSVGQQVAATGHFTGRLDGEQGERLDVEFADIFTVTPAGLLVAQSTYYFTPPS